MVNTRNFLSVNRAETGIESVNMPPLTGSTGSTIYSGLATVGKIHAVIGAVIGCIIAIIIIVIGIYQLKSPYTKSTNATITSIVSSSKHVSDNNNNTSVKYVSVVDLRYEIDSVAHIRSNFEMTTQTPAVKEMTITVRYNPHDVSDISQRINPRALGWGMIGGGALLALFTVGMTILTFKYKPLAALEGGAAAVNMIGDVL